MNLHLHTIYCVHQDSINNQTSASLHYWHLSYVVLKMQNFLKCKFFVMAIRQTCVSAIRFSQSNIGNQCRYRFVDEECVDVEKKFTDFVFSEHPPIWIYFVNFTCFLLMSILLLGIMLYMSVYQLLDSLCFPPFDPSVFFIRGNFEQYIYENRAVIISVFVLSSLAFQQ